MPVPTPCRVQQRTCVDALQAWRLHVLRSKQHAVAASMALQHYAVGLLGRCLWGWHQRAQAAGLQALHIKGMREYQSLMRVSNPLHHDNFCTVLWYV